MYMKDWIERLGLILTMNEYTILDHAGKITHELALHQAEEQYALFREHEREVERLESIRELDRDLKALKGLSTLMKPPILKPLLKASDDAFRRGFAIFVS